MTRLIEQANEGPTVRLTTDSPASSYGVPVLRIEDDTPTDYGPADIVVTPDYPRGERAAHIVCEHADDWPEGSAEWLACQAFCRQWPEGPQVVSG